MFELPEFGPLFAVAAPIAVILLGLATFGIVQRRKEKAARSTDHGHEAFDEQERPNALGGEPGPDGPRGGPEEPPQRGRDEGDPPGR